MFSKSYQQVDEWIKLEGPDNNIVISSRARLARNLDSIPFTPYATADTLKDTEERVTSVIKNIQYFNNYIQLDLSKLPGVERGYLRESRLISKEFEQSNNSKMLYISSDRSTSIMVNEEDHIRLQSILPGFQVGKALRIIQKVDNLLSEALQFAVTDRFGYLTACPTNTGTGLRLSVMLHLPGLVLLEKIQEIIAFVTPYGMTFRGFYGENTEYVGDFYQLSNEVTLGKTEEEILNQFVEIFKRILEREKEARSVLLADRQKDTDDRIWRSYGILTNARKISSSESMQLLSIIRLGIERGFFEGLNHHYLNTLIIRIQPCHLQWENQELKDAEARDIARAEILRQIFQSFVAKN